MLSAVASPDFAGLRVKAQNLPVPKLASNVTTPMLDSRSHPSYFNKAVLNDAFLAKLAVAGGRCSLTHMARVLGIFKLFFFRGDRIGDGG